jgi:cytochrome b561/polyisoprenoid-binding protein YceI
MKMATPNSIDSSGVQARYSAGAVTLHWLIALMLAFQLALGFSMPHDERGFELFQLHKSVGIVILLLSVARLAWRLTHRPPPAVEGGLGGALAHTVHVLLYVFMIGQPLTGWAMVSTDAMGIPTLLFGVIPWPHLPLPAGINEAMEVSHAVLAWTALALIILHIAGAVRHQFLLKDGLLRRIGPGGSAWAAGLLALLALALYFGTGMKIAGDVASSGGYATMHEHEQADEQAAEAAAAPEPEPTVEPAPDETAAPVETTAEATDDEPGPPPVWTIQPGGRLGFSVGNGDGAIRGSFSDWDGTIRFDPERPETASIRIEVKLASASVGDATQNQMLQEANFFGTSANPTATWRSTSVRATGPNRYTAQGALSLKGASHPQTLTFTLSGSGLSRHVEGSGAIDRTVFGVGMGEVAAGLGNSVSLTFAFDATGRAP